MKYGSLKRQNPKSLKISALNGGVDTQNHPDSIKDNCISACENMWYKDACLKTRPGFKASAEKAVDTMLYGYSGELEYHVTDTVLYYNGEYHRIATADVTTDDYAHYTYVYLLDLHNNIIPIGHLSFLRISSNIFYMPTRINFFNGKPQKGGGVYAMVTLCDKYNYDSKSYHIYEVNADFDGWERILDYYIPTVLINGRGNKYQTAKLERGFETPAQLEPESQNMLDGKFYAYYTTDGYSNSFRLPFNSLADAEVSCKMYYSLTDYIEWVIPADNMRDVKAFHNKDVSAYVDRDSGIIYFKADGADFAMPVMDMCSENNLKITATKEIKNGLPNIVRSPCVTRHNAKLLVAGGEDCCTVYVSDYDNPLYFPKNTSIQVGESNSEITCMLSQKGKVVVFKENELHLLDVKEGGFVSEITLLNDNYRTFKKADYLSSEQISSSIGCDNKYTAALYDGRSFWVGNDNKIYTFSLSGKKITEVCYCPELKLNNYYRDLATAVCGGGYYILYSNGNLAVVDISDTEDCKVFFWTMPEGVKIESGYYFAGKHRFLCTGSSSRLAYMATLEDSADSILYFNDDEQRQILQKDIPVKCGFTTKNYCLGGKLHNKNIEGIYFNLSAKGKVKIAVNDRYKTEVNFGFLNADYDKCEYKSVKLSPHLYNTDGVQLSLESDKEMSIGEMEIQYRVTV